MVTVGLAVTVAPVVALRLVLGAQVYVVAPPAVSAVELPVQMEGADGDTDIVGNGFTVTTTVCVFTQLLEFVPVTVYVIVTVGLAVTDAPVVAFRLVLGAHV
jgi:hypothetical protein